MGKRSDFKRSVGDYYVTPYNAVLPLLPHLGEYQTSFIEPCAGNGALIDHLEKNGHYCTAAYDIEPKDERVKQRDVFAVHAVMRCEVFITNPPWTRVILHPLIMHLCSQRTTWLLFDADWAHTLPATQILRHCEKIVSVGRVKWIPGSKYTGKDNCAWYKFNLQHTEGPRFFGRSPRNPATKN